MPHDAPPKNPTFYAAIKNALCGIQILAREKAARREITLIVCAIGLFALAPNLYSFAILVLSVVLLSIEGLNTALETLCDHVTPELHADIKAVKDLASAAVFIVVILIFVVFLMFLAARFG